MKIGDTVHVGGCGFDPRRLRIGKTPISYRCFSVGVWGVELKIVYDTI